MEHTILTVFREAGQSNGLFFMMCMLVEYELNKRKLKPLENKLKSNRVRKNSASWRIFLCVYFFEAKISSFKPLTEISSLSISFNERDRAVDECIRILALAFPKCRKPQNISIVTSYQYLPMRFGVIELS